MASSLGRHPLMIAIFDPKLGLNLALRVVEIIRYSTFSSVILIKLIIIAKFNPYSFSVSENKRKRINDDGLLSTRPVRHNLPLDH